MLSRFIRPNSLVIDGCKMLCSSNIRHFAQKKDIYRPQKKQQSLLQWDPFFDDYSILHPFQVDMERNLRDLHNKFGQYFGDAEFPACSTDIKENKDNFEVHVDIPGVKKEDIKVSVKDNVLTISGERKYDHTETIPEDSSAKIYDKDKENGNKQQFYKKERYFGKFVRSIALPENIHDDPSKINAKYNDGVLNITIPKKLVSEQEPKDHIIDIQ
jgi:HSP20 family protein